MRFTLDTHGFEIEDATKINNMIYFLSRNGIQHLVLRFTLANSYILPSSLFACSQLSHLTLENCSIQLHPPALKGFDRLISLELHYVEIASKNLGILISHCPLLEQLLLNVILKGDVIEINAPLLSSFNYCGSISSICLKNVPLLEELLLVDHELQFLKAGKVCEIAKFFESLPSLKHLELVNMFLSPRAGEVPTRLPFVLHSVKELRVSFLLTSLDVIPCTLRLMRSFPCLQYLEIKVFDAYNDIPASKHLQVLECFSDLTFNHLREVKLEGTMFEVQLVKLLLAKSPVLVRMLINLCEVKESARVKILDELSTIQPASPIAKIDFIF